ncbi:Ribosomal lysine N-methyltransferase 4 [Teratosphaeriaceae sp. CCFEE 6253]|nr:Ribosomal lysine N-methyltransferase 4 [Teratosphaeriaceae sp. CCFEE 6253]
MADVEVPDGFAANSQSFLAWLQQQGTSISPRIEIADLRSQGAGRGVLAKDDIPDDEVLFSILRSSILTTETSTLPADIKAKTDDSWLGLILAMAYECRQGSQSKWRSYFDVLPETFDTLMFWSADELKSLEGSAVLGKIGMATADTAFTEQLLPVMKQHATIFMTSEFSDAELLALCHRMGSVIMAYAFDLERPSPDPAHDQEDGWEEDQEESGSGAKGMIPLADMLNADADRNNAKLFYEEDRVVMKSIQPIKAGEEIFNDYGPLPSADVLRRYGYVTSNYAKYDVVEISLQAIRDTAAEPLQLGHDVLDQRLQYLDGQGALDDAYDVAHPGNEDVEQFPEELGMLLNVVTSPQADFDTLKQKGKLPKPTLNLAAAELLKRVLQKRRRLYPTSQESHDDMDTTGTNQHSRSARRKAMARQVIDGEQQVLAQALNSLQALTGSTGEKRKAEMDLAQPSKKSKG